jgi:hypothetical protein
LRSRHWRPTLGLSQGCCDGCIVVYVVGGRHSQQRTLALAFGLLLPLKRLLLLLLLVLQCAAETVQR